MWYALKIDGEIEAVMRSPRFPSFMDFNMGWASWRTYEVIEVEIKELNKWM